MGVDNQAGKSLCVSGKQKGGCCYSKYENILMLHFFCCQSFDLCLVRRILLPHKTATTFLISNI